MISSPLRYPGGKAKLITPVAEIIRRNDFFDRCYCEPYAGGAGLAIKLLTEGFVRSVKLNDIDDAIYAFWCSVFTATDEFCARVQDCVLSVEEWRRQRNIYESPRSNMIDRGFAAYYLNRTSRSGIIEGSGPIGGYRQQGNWLIDARFNRPRQIDNIQLLARFSDRVELSDTDAMDFIGDLIDDSKNFLYLDPPYYVKGRKLYKNYYNHVDHLAIRDRLEASSDRNWIVSYDDVSEIRAIYAPREPVCYSLNYSAGPVGKGTEVMFASDAVAIPPGLFRKAA